MTVDSEHMTNYQSLEAWKKSMNLVTATYVAVKSYPKEEVYALTSQTKRASVSIPANIAEGIGRNYKKDTIQFLHISRGSLYELQTLLVLGNSLGFLNIDSHESLRLQIEECLRLLNGLINYYEKSELK